MASFKEWSTNYPTSQDSTPPTTEQPTLSNNPSSVPRLANTGDNTRVSQIHTLRDKLDAVAKKVGDDSNLPEDCLLDRDSHSIHDDTIEEIYNIDIKNTPASADVILIEDSESAGDDIESSAWMKKKIQIGDLRTTDSDAIHSSVQNEINQLDLKATPISADVLVIEDSAAEGSPGYTKAKITIGSLPAAAPAAHAASHMSAGGDPIRLDELKAPTDVTTLNASTSTHGLLKKLSNSATQWMNGVGNWTNVCSATAPVNVTKSAASAGSSGYAARYDHKHDITTATAGAQAPGDSAAEGTATSLARSDHKHSLADFGTTADTFCEGNDSRLSDSRTDDDAIHQSVQNEINQLDLKATPISADVLVIEDSEAEGSPGYTKAKVTIGSVVALASSDPHLHLILLYDYESTPESGNVFVSQYTFRYVIDDDYVPTSWIFHVSGWVTGGYGDTGQAKLNMGDDNVTLSFAGDTESFVKGEISTITETTDTLLSCSVQTRNLTNTGDSVYIKYIAIYAVY